MALYREDIVDIELEGGSLYRTFLNRAIGKGDNMENRFGVRLFRNGEPVPMTNTTCEGFFMAPDATNILINGASYTSVSGNVAWVQLPQACYNVEGQFTLAIKVIDSSVTGTMRIVDGVVNNTGVTGAVAPTGTVPTYQEILSVFNQMEAMVDSNAMVLRSESGITDLNLVTTAGYYFLNAGDDYLNLPAILKPHTYGALLLKVWVWDNSYMEQELLVQTGHYRGMAFVRRRSNSNWEDWVKRFVMENIPVTVDNGVHKYTDLNDCVNAGYYLLESSYQYANMPPELMPHTNGALTLEVYLDSTSYYKFQKLYMINGQFTGAIYIRRFGDNEWKPWVKISGGICDEGVYRTPMSIFSPVSCAEQGENKGFRKLRVMTYNMAGFNNDTDPAVYIDSARLFNLKKFLMKVNPDFLLAQEHNGNLDGDDGTLSVDDYLYHPVLRARYGWGGVAIVTKEYLDSWGILEYTNGRQLRYGVYNLGDGKKLLLISTHPVWNAGGGGHSSTDIAARKTQYDELFAWIKGEITLNSFGTTTAVSVPEGITHCIIGMDGNSCEAQDKTNLTNAATGANCILGNGGYLGWFVTCYDNYLTPKGVTQTWDIDNIIVSDNIIIENIESYGDWFGKLYSDHVPVVADLMLKDTEWTRGNT